MVKEKKVIYYNDELNDDFANNNINTKSVKTDHNYYPFKNVFFKSFAFIFRYTFAIPVLVFLNVFVFNVKIVNKKALKNLKNKGYFVYSNHVLPFDPIIPPVMFNPSKFMVIVSGIDAFSIHPFVTFLIKSLGAIPVPRTVEMYKNMNNSIKTHINKKHRVLIYPEAHIWPYYNKIRNFPETSFHFPVNLNSPIVVMTTTFKERKFIKKPQPVIYIDGPIYPNLSLDKKERIQDLRNKCFDVMTMRSNTSENFEYIKYIKNLTDN